MRPDRARPGVLRTGWSRILLAVPACAAWLGAVGCFQPVQRPVPSGLDLYMPVPAENPLRQDVVALGRALFFEQALSRDSSLACASCHRPSEGFSDGRRLSQGVFGRQGARNVPTILNRGYGRSFFWDGRISTLEEQVLQPILAADEMDMSVEEAVGRLRRNPEYVAAFRRIFERMPNEKDLARSLASYVRTLRTGDSRFDRFVDGDRGALSELEVRGQQLFQGRARCVRCHMGATFTDERFHNTGVAWREGELHDLGRYTVSGAEMDRGAFKTPTLRQVAKTAPYMHDGSLATLEAVLDFYDGGGTDNPYRDPLIRSLGLDEDERAALVAFLGSLTGVVSEGTWP